MIPVTGPAHHSDDRRPPRSRLDGVPYRDEVIAELLAGGLLGDLAVRSGFLEVQVQNGVAILEGSVPTEDVRIAILRRARATPGVREICDLLTVEGAG